MRDSVFVDKAHGDDVVTLAEQALGNIVAARRILVVGDTDLLAVHEGVVLVEERAEQQACRLAGMGLVHLDVLTEPEGAGQSPPVLECPTIIPLADLLPVRVVEAEGCPVFTDAGILGVQHLLPLLFGLHVGLTLGFHVFIVLEELRPLHQHGVVALQGVGRDPGLNRRTAPTVDDDALRHARLFIHAAAKEIADSREEPRILLVDRFPVDSGGVDVRPGTVGVCLVGYAEKADVSILVGVNIFCILWIDALNGDIDVGLSGQEPHVTY